MEEIVNSNKKTARLAGFLYLIWGKTKNITNERTN